MKRECNIAYCEVFYVFFRIKVELDLNNSSSTLEDYDMDDYEEGEELDKNVTKMAKYRYHLTFLSLSNSSHSFFHHLRPNSQSQM